MYSTISSQVLVNGLSDTIKPISLSPNHWTHAWQSCDLRTILLSRKYKFNLRKMYMYCYSYNNCSPLSTHLQINYIT